MGKYVLKAGISLDGLKPKFRERLLPWIEALPFNVVIASTLRDSKEQTVLYHRFLAGLGPPANRPGTSSHENLSGEGGEAADVHPDCPIEEKAVRFREMQRTCEKYGLKNLQKEPWHYQDIDWVKPQGRVK
jgi:hypothetical protein